MYILQVEKLHKKYNNFEAIKGIDLEIKKGEIYGLLGPNGAGKSTLIKIISGLEKITSGKIIFEEKETNINKYKRNIGLLPQDIAIYHIVALAQIASTAVKQSKANGFKEPIGATLKAFIEILKCK
jgi:ABC-type multidrug transport system ATPase subunit